MHQLIAMNTFVNDFKVIDDILYLLDKNINIDIMFILFR